VIEQVEDERAAERQVGGQLDQEAVDREMTGVPVAS
jgi:hypothetical protein